MDFNFPDNKVIHHGIIKTKVDRNQYSKIDIMNPLDNIITIDGTEYCFIYLNDSGKNKGGNSIILKLFEAQNIDTENVEYDIPDMILKILKFKNEKTPSKAEKRFKMEITALKESKERNSQNVIEVFHDGVCRVKHLYKDRYEEYLYYTMEYADSDLKSFIESNLDLTLEEKIDLCLSLAQGLKELWSLGYYHRDIKPDNIFFVNSVWKIGDLGLLSKREEQSEIDRQNEFVGPRGWLSPEAMNKYLCEENDFPFSYNCIIDHQSDIFQLGRVFWYILQNNNPIGVFRRKDFYIKNEKIYQLIRTMLNYSKSKRYKTIDEVIEILKPIKNQVLIEAS